MDIFLQSVGLMLALAIVGVGIGFGLGAGISMGSVLQKIWKG